ncbi:putative sulfate exporter family transporter [Desulfovibrio sp. ZJ369]|uniref:YeiH family protein n=1 Tax=Desulfovibrio sp. ZJ369 TaxID=2709793 RepID=UPI0013EA190F|nr:putative sulfate exporter family transporter [Desulfovibrio sp. ZJ369]
MASDSPDIVVDRSKAQWSDLWLKEDYWAIWIGLILLLVGTALVFSNKGELESKYESYAAVLRAESAKPFKTVEYYQAAAAQKALQGQNLSPAKDFIGYLKTPARWQSNPLDALFMTQAAADEANKALKPKVDAARQAASEALARAKEAQSAAAAASFGDASLNDAATKAIGEWQAAQKKVAKVAKGLVKPFNRIPTLIVLGLVLTALTAVGIKFMGGNVGKYMAAFLVIFALCLLANILGNHKGMRLYGLNAEIWSIALGMLIANTIGTPKWIKDGALVEYFIKTGLVLLGAEVLFHKILAIGIPGIFVAWVVTPIVLISTYIFGQKVLKMPSKTLNIVISADMSVCGTSAAIATAAAARAKKEELTLSIGLSLTFTAIMMIALPAFIKWVGMPEVLGGAWIGGTVDATGAVAAAGAFVGEKAMQVAATVKMIQNVLIGVTAFCVAMYWCTKVDVQSGERVGVMEIWNRFPKFVLGFLAVSIIYSLISTTLGADFGKMLVDNGVNKVSVPLRGWFFALAFVSIGLTTDFRELGKYFKGGKPIILYVCGQSLNLALTLLMAWIMFYKVFPEITAKI